MDIRKGDLVEIIREDPLRDPLAPTLYRVTSAAPGPEDSVILHLEVWPAETGSFPVEVFPDEGNDGCAVI